MDSVNGHAQLQMLAASCSSSAFETGYIFGSDCLGIFLKLAAVNIFVKEKTGVTRGDIKSYKNATGLCACSRVAA